MQCGIHLYVAVHKLHGQVGLLDEGVDGADVEGDIGQPDGSIHRQLGEAVRGELLDIGIWSRRREVTG